MKIPKFKFLVYDAWHCHENAHISFVARGGCSEKKKYLYERLPGTTIFYRSSEPHQMVQMENSLHVNLEMDHTFFENFGFTDDNFGNIIRKTPDARFALRQNTLQIKTTRILDFV